MSRRGPGERDYAILVRRRESLARALRHWRSFRPLAPMVGKLEIEVRAVDLQLDEIEGRRRAS